MKYVALLRGINVGGKNKVDMKQLKTVCERLGWLDVRTYINSGNVIFTHNTVQPPVLAAELAREIESEFGFAVSVIVKSHSDMRAVLKVIPNEWQNNPDMKCDVLFLWDELEGRELVEMLKPRNGIDDVRTVPGAVVWKVDRVNASKSGLMRIMGTPQYRQVTIRNINTTRKLLELMEIE